MPAFHDVIARFGEAQVAYLPDLTLWYPWHQRRGTLPAEWLGYAQADVAAALGATAWCVDQPWRVEYRGVEVTEEESVEARIVRYATPHGALTAVWSLGPDGDWWQTEYPVKTREDLPAARDVISARTYILGGRPARGAARAGQRAVVALELPMQPYSDLLHTMLGWGEGLLLLRGEGRPILLEMLAELAEKLRGLAGVVAALPGDVLFAPDNLDGNYISPKVFREHMAASYRAAADAAHATGKEFVVHAGGPVLRLLPLLAEAGVDVVEGIAPAPQGDATLREARAVAPDLTLWGGIPQDFVMDARTEEEFESAVAQATQQAAGDPKMILGVADRVPVQVDLARLKKIVASITRSTPASI